MGARQRLWVGLLFCVSALERPDGASLSPVNYPLLVLGVRPWALSAEGDGGNLNWRGRWTWPESTAEHRDSGASQRPGQVRYAGAPEWGVVSHLQLQERSLSSLHTCQATAASLEPQEDGDLGAVQASAVQVSVGKNADLLWEGGEKRARR